MECKTKAGKAIKLGQENGALYAEVEIPDLGKGVLQEVPYDVEKHGYDWGDERVVFESADGEAFLVSLYKRDNEEGYDFYLTKVINGEKKYLKGVSQQNASTREAALEAALRRAAEIYYTQETHRSDPQALREQFDRKPTHKEMSAAYARLRANFEAMYPGVNVPNEIEFVFEQPVQIYRGFRKGYGQAKKTHKLRLFESTIGELCYAISPRKGFPVSELPDGLTEIRIPSAEDKQVKKAQAIERLKKLIYPGAWDDLREELEKNPRKYLNAYERTLRPVNLKAAFGPYHGEQVVAGLKKAFETKTEFRYSLDGEKRDKAVEAKLCKDGVFRAWYTSYYAGTGNGTSYVILNPTTAAFAEDD